MSRNKAILIALIGIAAFLMIPDTPSGLYAKEIMVRLLTYFLLFLTIYLIITIHMLRRSLKKLIDHVTDENVAVVVKRLRITFDVKRIFGIETLKIIYQQVNSSKKIMTKSKLDLYEAMRRKRIDVPLPAKGR